jgi:hypothetical protein
MAQTRRAGPPWWFVWVLLVCSLFINAGTLLRLRNAAAPPTMMEIVFSQFILVSAAVTASQRTMLDDIARHGPGLWS